MSFKKGEEITPKVEQLKVGENKQNEAILEAASKLWEARPEHTKKNKSEFSQEMRNLDKQLHAPGGLLKDQPDLHVVGYTKGDRGPNGLLVTSDKEKGVVYSVDSEGKAVNRFVKVDGRLQKDEQFGVENRAAEPAKFDRAATPAENKPEKIEPQKPPTPEGREHQADKSPQLETTFKNGVATTTLKVGSGEQWSTTNGYEWQNPEGLKIFGRARIHKDAQGNVDDVTISSMDWKTWSYRRESKFNADGTTDETYYIHGAKMNATWHLNDKGSPTHIKNHMGEEWTIGYAADGITPNKFKGPDGQSWSSPDNVNWSPDDAAYNTRKYKLEITRGNPTVTWTEDSTGNKWSAGYYTYAAPKDRS